MIHYNLVHKFCPLPQAMKTPDAQAAVDKEWKKLEAIPAWQLKQLAEDWDYKHFTADGQFTEHEDLRVKPLSFHLSITASTYDSAESIATPPRSRT